LLAVGEAMLESPDRPERERMPLGRGYIVASAATVELLLFSGQEGLALMLLDRLERLVAELYQKLEQEPALVGSLRRVQAIRAIRAGDPGAGIDNYAQ